MTSDIYGDLWGEILVKKSLNYEMVYLYEGNGRYTPRLILPNLLAVKRLRDFLDQICKENKDYFKKVGEPLK